MNTIRNLSIGTALAIASTVPAWSVDEAGAQELLKSGKCLNCHSVDKKKDGPSYSEIAKKYKGKPEAEAKLTKHVSEKSKVEIDGKMKDHGNVKTRDPAKIKNLVEWVLSR